MTNRSTATQRERMRECAREQPHAPPEDRASASTVPPEVGTALLLDSVAAITHMRDSNALDRSLVLSLAELTLADCVQLHRHPSFTNNIPASMVQCRRQSGQPLSVTVQDTNLPPAPDLLPERRPDTHSLPDGRARIRVPVFNDSRLLATLLIDNPGDLESAQHLVAGFARIYANYIALLDESERDKLTGLYNRRTFDRHLRQRLEAVPQVADANAASVWVAIVDIDNFKRVNDTFGHLYGDEVILLIAQRMRHSFGEHADLFRFGGEEFVILFHATDEARAGCMLELFRQHVAERPFPQVGTVSVSMGFCRISRQDFPEAALDRADQALYYAKSHGRNQLHGYEKLIRSGRLRAVTTGSIDLF